MSNPSLSVKCSYDTRDNLKELFASNQYFINLNDNDVNTNVSWFFKHSANIFLSLLENNLYKIRKSHLILFDYQNAFENQFASKLDNVTKYLT